MNPGRRKPGRRTRTGVGALLGLFLAYILLSGLMPHHAAADDSIPIQLQAVCHAGPGTVSKSQPDAPQSALPCCVLCCGASHQLSFAPPSPAILRVAEPRIAGQLEFRPYQPDGHGRDTRPPRARAPPALT